jgi:hypothetical protein
MCFYLKNEHIIKHVNSKQLQCEPSILGNSQNNLLIE